MKNEKGRSLTDRTSQHKSLTVLGKQAKGGLFR